MGGDDDCNNFGFGIFLCTDNGVKNVPGVGWWLILSANVGGTAVQVAYALWDLRIYKRYCASGDWSGWSIFNDTQNSTLLGSLTGDNTLNVDTSPYKFVYFVFNNTYATDIFSISALKNQGVPRKYIVQDGYSFSVNPHATDNTICANLSMEGYYNGGVAVYAIK